MPEQDLDRAFDTLVVEVERVVRPPGAGRARTTLLARRATAGGVALLVVAVGGLAVAVQGDPGSHGPEPAPPVTTPRTPTDSGSKVFSTSRIDGHWHTRHLQPAELAGLLNAAGRGDVLVRWEAHHPPGPARLTLSASVMQGHSLWLGTDARPYVTPLDWGLVEPRGDRVVLHRHHASDAGAALRYTVSGARLTFDVVRSAWPERDGVPGRAQVRALYSSLPFTRFVGSGPTG